MKKSILLIGLVGLQAAAQTTIDPVNLHAYAANAGWISFSSSTAYAQTTVIDPGPDSDFDLIPDSWEYSRTNTLNALNPGDAADADEDGVSDADEYRADTDPFDDTDFPAITQIQANGSTNAISWPGKATRLYTLLETDALVPPPVRRRYSAPWVS